jgi:Putative phage tail protein
MARIALIAGVAAAGIGISILTGGLGTFAVGAWAADIIAGAAVGGSLGATLGAFLFPSKMPFQPGLQDLQVMSSAAGSPIPFGYAGFRIGGQVIWASLIKETQNQQSQGGGKGGPTSTVYTYTVDAAIAFCKGSGSTKITRIWADSKLIYDSTGKGAFAIGTGLSNHHGAVTVLFDPVFYSGGSTQTVDPTIQAAEGVDSTPAMRDLCYMVLNNFPLADFGNRIPNFRAEISSSTSLEYTKDIYPGTSIPSFTSGSPGGQIYPPSWCFVDPTNRVAFVLDQYGQVCQRVDINETTGQPVDPWVANTVYAPGDEVLDSNGSVEVVIAVSSDARSGSSAPAWVTGEGNNTADHHVTWKNVGPGPNAVVITATGRFNPLIAGLTYNGNTADLCVNLNLPTCFCVDTQGFLWGHCKLYTGSTPHDYLVKYDPRTFQAVGKVQITIATRLGGIAAVKIGDTNYIYAVQYDFSGGTATLYVVDTAHLRLSTYVFATYAAAEIPRAPTIDPATGECYLLVDDGGYAVGSGNAFEIYCGNPLSGSFVPRIISFTSVPYAVASFGLLFDAADDSLISIGVGGEMQKIDIATGSILATTSGARVYVQGGDQCLAKESYRGLVPEDGVLRVLVTSGISGVLEVAYYDAATLTLQQTVALSQWLPATATGVSGASYDPVSNSLVMATDNGNTDAYTGLSERIYFDRQSVPAEALSAIITDLVSQAGMDTSLLDVSRVTSIEVLGYCVTQNANVKSILQPLAQAFFWDMVETGGKLVVIPRGQSVSTTIPESDLGLLQEEIELTENIAQEQDLPKFMTVTYNDPAQDYQPGKQLKFRNSKVIKTNNQTILQLPITLDSDTAAQIAADSLATVWAERNNYDIALAFAKYLVLDPTDVIQFTYQGIPFQGRVTKASVGQDRIIKITVASEDPRNYESATTGGANLGFQGGTILSLGPTLLFIFDIPLLRDTDSVSPGITGYYVAMSPPVLAGWPGGLLLSSTDDLEYAQIDSEMNAATYGYVLAATPAPSNWELFAWDTVTTITVRLAFGSLSSTSMLAVLNGANAFILGPEVMQFQNATLNADGTYTLSNLLRGIRGTEWACSEHQPGETLVVLTPASFERESLPTSFVGVPLYLKGVTIGNLPAGTTPQDVTLQGNDLKPYAPCSIAGSRDVSHNLTITWIRRTRVGGENDWLDGVTDVPLSETTELYDLDILNGLTVVRTFSGLTSPTASYTAAEQTTDFGSTQPAVSLNVYQRSSAVGRGFPGSSTV